MVRKQQYLLKNFIKQIDKVIPGFANGTNTVYAPSFEMGWKKFEIDNTMQTNTKGIYIGGDATVHFRGAMQSMASGILIAKHIIKQRCYMETLIFVTGNMEKLNIAREALKNTGINIINKKIKCPEIQSDDTEEIAKFSAKYASDKLKSNIVKIDSGLFLEEFDGFPRTLF